MDPKRIGILGGMSPESTSDFYSLLVKKYLEKYGNHSFPEVVIFSVNFQKIVDLQFSQDKENYIKELLHGIKSLEDSRVDFIVIASNTPHMVIEELQEQSNVPILSIVDSVIEEVLKTAVNKTLLLGTKFTMQSDYYKKVFAKSGHELIIPSADEQEEINGIIFKELVKGIIKEASKKRVIEIINKYQCDGVILGCTELPMIIKKCDVPAVTFDTLSLHVQATLDYSMQNP